MACIEHEAACYAPRTPLRRLPVLQISCAFPPGPDVVEHAKLAESLGYERAWLYDSPALYPDIYVTLARIAERTEHIGLGTAVLIPHLRHPVTQAAAIATIEGLAPGRLAVALGTGFTGRMTMGQKPLTWASMSRYLRQLTALLAGEAVEVDGAMAQLIAPPGYLPERPIGVPILVGANGPKGLGVAREIGAAGIICAGRPQPGWDWCGVLLFGTVLDEGETPGERALEAAGPGAIVRYHGIYEADPAQLERLPRGAEWRAMIEQFPAETRHLKVHDEHLTGISQHDRPFLDGETAVALTASGTAEQVRARLEQMEQGGATEVLYQPAGPDIPRELRAFAAAAGMG
jgi:5,10-methylenetetrahydromethanopterin reductase